MSNVGGDPVTQLIVYVYRSLVTQQIHWPYQPKQSPSSRTSYLMKSVLVFVGDCFLIPPRHRFKINYNNNMFVMLNRRCSDYGGHEKTGAVARF